MASPPSDGQPQFLALADTVHARMLPGAEMANPALSAVIMERNAETDDMTVDYTADNLFTMDHPAVQWLRQCCDRHSGLRRRSRHFLPARWSLQGWGNVNFRGDYHNLHNHPHSGFRDLLCECPGPERCETYRSDLNPGAISFFDPRPQAI